MGEKADSELVRRQNRRIVLDALRQHGALARVELGRMTGLSPASITAISAQLIDERLIHELTAAPNTPSSGKRGRPLVRLDLKPEAALVVAVKISINDVELQLADFAGRIIARGRHTVSTLTADGSTFGAMLAELIASFMASSPAPKGAVARVGVAVQGLADMRDGRIVWSPAFHDRDIDIAQAVEARIGAHCLVANDANMIAEGLVTLDRERYGGVTAAIFTGYGVGMGLIIDGKVFHGATGAACEFGHMNHLPHGAPCRCGRRGCIEAYVADYGIMRLARGDTDSHAPTDAVPDAMFRDLQTRASKGDVQARHAFEQAGEVLGYGLARLIAILNPDRIVLAGPGMETAGLMEAAMQRALADGIVEDLRRDVAIEQISFSTDMIMRGTIDALLRSVLRDDFASGQILRPGAIAAQ
jgi:predicted NBD/HSP70 family sugar kinase